MDDRPLPQADSVAWMGLCPCGCGTFKAILLDESEKGFAIFGWDRDGWLEFIAGVMGMIGESNEQEEAGQGPLHDYKTH